MSPEHFILPGRGIKKASPSREAHGTGNCLVSDPKEQNGEQKNHVEYHCASNGFQKVRKLNILNHFHISIAKEYYQSNGKPVTTLNTKA